MYTLIGIVTVVRHERVTDFLVPILAIAPTLLMAGAFETLHPWEWVYAVGYTLGMAAALSAWARTAFQRHIVRGG
ncbi:MAG: hypothetical protein GVY29_10215 [Spirochaetes bacterium]|jgi:fluoroquinolone transport system permease protein|nr:hypothetical protein [Spirochaetota bacterium]